MKSKTDIQSLYFKYVETTQKAADFNNAAALLDWDQEVNMPSGSATFRARQSASLAEYAHHLITDESYGKILQQLADTTFLSESQQANVLLSLEDFHKHKKLPASIINKLTNQASISFQAWTKAKKKNQFSLFYPELEKMIALKRQQCDLYGFQTHPYDALLDDYDKGITTTRLDEIFGEVKTHLSNLLEKILQKPQVEDDFLYQAFDKENQFSLSIEILKSIGFNFEEGRQDYSEHPFTTSFSPQDVRITTRAEQKNFKGLIWSSIHEGGHALYEQGLPTDAYGLPLGMPASLSIHESQSRLWENCVGRSAAFLKYFFPLAKQKFSTEFEQVDTSMIYKAVNKVQPSLIRTEADELTYHFHVLIRYEIEKALIAGEIQCKDLPTVWNELYNKYLKVVVPNDTIGVLQDVHWSHGSFGYFPTYSLGSFYAVQFFEAAKKENPTIEQDIQIGNFQLLLQWLRQKVHRYGRRYSSDELSKLATGSELNFSLFMKYAREKYSAIYGFDVN
ncbi:MAG: carboxypeptidase M32 [Bacteroidetes bacterium]|nr:carboxypeptidase M32 [Bacteroidota bacterium]